MNHRQLASTAVEITSVAEQTESDVLFLIEDVAICVEVKGRSVSHQARGGHVQRLTGDLRSTVGDATDQALRLEGLIRTNGGLWLEDKTSLDLSGVREVRSIAVCLDDMGPLGTALDELVRGDVIKSDQFPWVVSLMISRSFRKYSIGQQSFFFTFAVAPSRRSR